MTATLKRKPRTRPKAPPPMPNGLFLRLATLVALMRATARLSRGLAAEPREAFAPATLSHGRSKAEGWSVERDCRFLSEMADGVSFNLRLALDNLEAELPGDVLEMADDVAGTLGLDVKES